MIFFRLQRLYFEYSNSKRERVEWNINRGMAGSLIKRSEYSLTFGGLRKVILQIKKCTNLMHSLTLFLHLNPVIVFQITQQHTPCPCLYPLTCTVTGMPGLNIKGWSPRNWTSTSSLTTLATAHPSMMFQPKASPTVAVTRRLTSLSSSVEKDWMAVWMGSLNGNTPRNWTQNNTKFKKTV